MPIGAGLSGILAGPRFLGLSTPWPVDLASHLRFLSGIFLAMGLAWWSCLLDIETSRHRFRLLGVLTIAGGVARLASIFVDGRPSAGHLIGLGLELLAVPLLLIWHRRILPDRED